MRTLHITVGKFESDAEFEFVDAWLRMLSGVSDIAFVRSAGLVSVLYDEHKTGPRGILRALRSSGFEARTIEPTHAPPVAGVGTLASERPATGRQLSGTYS